MYNLFAYFLFHMFDDRLGLKLSIVATTAAFLIFQ